MVSAIRYVIFDLGSTLIHFDGDWPTVFAEADQVLCAKLEDLGLGHFNASFSQDFRTRMAQHHHRREKDYIEAPTTAILAETLKASGYPAPSSKHLQAAVDSMYKTSQANWQLEEDATPALQSLRNMGCQLGILSNAGDDNDVQTLVKNTGLQEIFDFILSSAAVGIRKPDPRVFEMSLAHWNARPEQTMMVGDTLDADILGANNAGLHSVWITRRADRPENMANEGRIIPDSVINALSELPTMVGTLG
jgi:2-haloalkanoic acid dehalogenase type II